MVWGRRSFRLGARVLRRGAEGPDVARLQEWLKDRGYDPGDVDGRFGFLTEDALRQFQNDYALRPDGVAGDQVYQVLLSPRPVPPRRRVHRLTRGCSAAAAARELGVSVSYLSRVNRLRGDRLQAGQTLVVHPRWALLEVDPESAGMLAQGTLDRHGTRLTGIIAPWKEGVGWPAGAVGWLPWPFAWNRWPAGGSWRRRTRPDQEVAAAIDEAAANKAVRGFFLPRRVSWGQGQAWAQATVSLSEYLYKRDLTLMVGLPQLNLSTPWNRAFNDLHLARWVPWVQVVMLPAPAPGPGTTFGHWLTQVRSLRDHLPLWKLVVGIDWRAVETDERGRRQRRLTHQQALALCFSQRTRPAWDQEAQCLSFRYQSGDGERRVYLWSARTLELWLERIQLYGFGGVCLGPAGAEDPRLWDVFYRQFCSLQHVC